MKIRIIDRILVALAGLVLIGLAGAVVAEMFFAVPLTAMLGEVLLSKTTQTIAIVAGIAAVVLLVGVFCVGMLFRHSHGKRGFVMQKTESGDLSISIKAIESLVQKCIDKHDELHVLQTQLENSRDGLIIKLRIGLANGVNIPLVVSNLQKQIKQYVTACSGVDVREVKVQVETASAKLKDSPYAVSEVLESVPVPKRLESDATPPVPDTVVTSTVPVPGAPEEAKDKSKDDRPLHQRIFGRHPDPVTVDQPPVTVEAPASVSEAAPEAEAAADEPKEETPTAAEDAVTEAENDSEETKTETEEVEPAQETAYGTTEDGEVKHEIAE